MLYTLFFCAIIASVASQRPVRPANQEIYYLPAETVEKVKKFTVPCIEKHGADPDIFRKLVAGTMAENDVNKDWLLCFAVGGKFTNEEGHFNIPKMSSLIGNHPKLGSFQAALDECNKVTKETPRETVHEMSICINEKSPVALSV